MAPDQALLAARQVLLLAGVILFFGSVLGFAAGKLHVPDIVLFLLGGIGLGPEGANVIGLNAGSALNQLILVFGAAYILFDGGASLRLAVLKDVWITVVVLATVGVLVTAFLTAFLAEYVLGIPFLAALLLGATLSPTDPATLMPVFRQVRIRTRVAQTVIGESALNDALGAIATGTVLAIALGHAEFSPAHALLDLLQQAGVGIAIGAALGYLAIFAIADERFAFLHAYMPLASLMVVIGAYLSAIDLNASGFMAVFIAGVVVGNKELFGYRIEPHAQEGLAHYVAATSLIARMFIFMLLGSHVDFALLGRHWAAALAVVLFFMFIARPLTVFLCAAPDRRARWEWRELLFMSWVRETGVMPSALAGLLLGAGAPDADLIASVVFVAVLLTILLQATTTGWWGARLGLEQE